MPQAFASLSVRSAPGMNATSTILPLTVNTPIPAAAASRNALTMASACATSFSVGAKIWCTSRICFGLIRLLPSKPIALFWRTSASKPLVVVQIGEHGIKALHAGRARR